MAHAGRTGLVAADEGDPVAVVLDQDRGACLQIRAASEPLPTERSIEIERVQQGVASGVQDMVAGKLDHVRPDVLQQRHMSGWRRNEAGLRRRRTIGGEGNLMADVGHIGLAQPIPDVAPGQRDAGEIHLPGGRPCQRRHTRHHHHRQTRRVSVGCGPDNRQPRTASTAWGWPEKPKPTVSG